MSDNTEPVLLDSLTYAQLSEYIDNVARGAALLDELAPGWREHVDIHTLDVSDPYYCVLGQLFSARHPDGYLTCGFFTGVACLCPNDTGCVATGPTHNWCVQHGFDVGEREFALRHHNALTIIWKGVIRNG